MSTREPAGGVGGKEEKSDKGKFVNHGLERWRKVRAEWTKNSQADESQVPDIDDMDDDIDDLMNDEELDAEHVIYCLRQYLQFPDPIPLKTIVNLLNILWDDEFV
uniref:Uncharacterized protein n=1 Tax=Lotharella globosa TaxID=91324 RepID=A0A6V3L405_9EUKA|mmetsp:Transcript_32456/g.63436  ORF Transcript_32456/g.63436 Transcript_32456/m.63436 type:complete len:105 (+) Transcript_32456:26-340(+)|eukprot:CAMPEP_0167791870 /NCGR_PEP_ID=MMETSP0111_2-20121227/12208_1 /TAXON_ID=91324 /ORGANISM="Lotharella globosa, Strain CCCM811" /LENGTH=104 /DNA_ID=CAMNT_0007684651 /DNA_START=53 /DNA_END=367 /DNA_ORIENTATION=+